MDLITEGSNLVVQTKDGPVRGFVEEKNDRKYYQFTSIPYAQPPVGSRRFLAPCPVRPWTETIDCTKPTPSPLSFSFKNEIIGSEDCLYLEVSSPSVRPGKPIPVMFWIGSYCFEGLLDHLFDPSFLNDQEIVIVRCGFRLGPLGFLSMNDISAPGNCGPKDIVMALKWVQNNILQFGGDPNNVTIFGSSSGGAIVHLLMLSPMANGLFHKAIIQSASALNNWSLAKNPIQSVKNLVTEMGITKTCTTDIIEELRNASATDIMSAFGKLQKRIKEESDCIEATFKPCIEEEFEGQPAFLTKSPLIIIKSGNFNKVPLIIGSNNIEAALLQYIKDDFYNDFEKFNENLHLLVPKSMSGELKMSKQIGEQLLNFYLDGEKTLREDTRNQYLQLISDYYYLYYIQKTVQLHREHAPECPVYYYVVYHAGEWSVPNELVCFNTIGHSAELPFIFGLKVPGTSNLYRGSRDSVKTRNRVIKMWTNFAKFGNPTPDEEDPLLQIKWDPVESTNKISYLSVGTELTKGRNPFSERMAFWDELHKEHRFLRALVYFSDLGVTW